MDASDKNLKSTLDLLFQFSKYSGLKPNISKTKAIWIGSKANSNDYICKDYNIQWENGPFSILGITFTSDLTNIEKLNYEDNLYKIQNEILSWNKRNITPIGKVTVVKSLLIPKLTHIFNVLPKPSQTWITRLENILYKFIWNNKPDKISRENIQQDFVFGGLRMTNITFFIKSLKLTWLRRILQNHNNMWANVFFDTCKCDITSILPFGTDYLNFLQH